MLVFCYSFCFFYPNVVGCTAQTHRVRHRQEPNNNQRPQSTDKKPTVKVDVRPQAPGHKEGTKVEVDDHGNVAQKVLVHARVGGICNVCELRGEFHRESTPQNNMQESGKLRLSWSMSHAVFICIVFCTDPDEQRQFLNSFVRERTRVKICHTTKTIINARTGTASSARVIQPWKRPVLSASRFVDNKYRRTAPTAKTAIIAAMTVPAMNCLRLELEHLVQVCASDGEKSVSHTAQSAE